VFHESKVFVYSSNLVRVIWSKHYSRHSLCVKLTTWTAGEWLIDNVWQMSSRLFWVDILRCHYWYLTYYSTIPSESADIRSKKDNSYTYMHMRFHSLSRVVVSYQYTQPYLKGPSVLMKLKLYWQTTRSK